MEQTYRSQILDHLGLVAGMFDELGIGEVVDKATQQNPEMRDLTVGEAVKGPRSSHRPPYTLLA